MILDDIVSDKRLELEAAERRVTPGEIVQAAGRQPPTKYFADALRGDRIHLIAEVKRTSPSRGMIAVEFDPVATARRYAENGAAAISVLTESKYFQGSLDYLVGIGQTLGEQRLPMLRKDFIF